MTSALRPLSRGTVILLVAAAGVLWMGWRAVPRPAHVVRTLRPATGCPRPMPANVTAPAELGLLERCVLLWSAFEFLSDAGVPADTAVIESVAIDADSWFGRSGRGSLFPHPHWVVSIRMRPGPAPAPVWTVVVSRHHGERRLWQPRPAEWADLRARADSARR